MKALQRRTLCLAIVAFLVATSPVCAQEVGSVGTLEGTPEVGHGGTWTELQIGAVIAAGDEVRTNDTSRVRVVLTDGSVLNVGKQTALTISESTTDSSGRPQRTVVRLHKGALEAVVGPGYASPDAAFDVETATAVATVRGTEFVVSYDPVAEVSNITGVTGQVQVYSIAGRLTRGVLVTPQEATTVAKNGAPAAPRQLTEIAFRQRIEELEFAGIGRPESLVAALRTASRVPPPDRAPRRLKPYEWPFQECRTPFCGFDPPTHGPSGLRVNF